jgi:hypothetical protein
VAVSTPAGRTGVFIGPQDLYFAILGNSSSTVSVYRTPGFKGKSHALYTIDLAKPSRLGCGLFPGPAALAAPRVGAEAAATAAKRAQDAADKAAEEAAEAAEKAAADGSGADAAAADASAGGTAAAASSSEAAAVQSQSAKLHIRRPGETWRPTGDDSGDESTGGDMMIPVLGIGAAYQGPVGKGLAQHGRGKQQGQQQHGVLGFVDHAEQEEEAAAGERHSGGGVIMWHAGGLSGGLRWGGGCVLGDAGGCIMAAVLDILDACCCGRSKAVLWLLFQGMQDTPDSIELCLVDTSAHKQPLIRCIHTAHTL